MTIASAFNDIAVAQGGTAAKSGSITAAIDGIEVVGNIDPEEAEHYVKRAPKGTTRMKVETDGDYVNIWYYDRVPFERIRRVTGYLTGSVSRWNDAKRAELHDRVKHATPKF